MFFEELWNADGLGHVFGFVTGFGIHTVVPQ